jgi:hypothetical protein
MNTCSLTSVDKISIAQQGAGLTHFWTNKKNKLGGPMYSYSFLSLTMKIYITQDVN